MIRPKEMDPVTRIHKAKREEKFFEFKKTPYKEDDVGELIRLLKRAGYTAKGKKAFDENGNHKGFKCSAKCCPDLFAWGHNKRLEGWVEDRCNIDPYGYHKTYLDCQNLDACYKQIFREALEEYNRTRRNDRKIKNYLTHILQDQRRGTMKSKSTTDNSRKPMYEFEFQIGKRDNRLDTETSIFLLDKFIREWLPAHYPNLVPIGIYLHADEYTIDPVTGQRLDGSVHVHFDFVPVCHALNAEEKTDEKKWKAEEKKKAMAEAQKKGLEFDEKKFKNEWSKKRVQKYGKALDRGMKLQSSLSGACNEMGFWTQGKITAQIQMEEAIRQDLLDFVEGYGIKVDRSIETDRDEEVSIQEYKDRENNKAILAASKEILEYNKRLEEQNLHAAEQNEKVAKANSEKEQKLEIRQKEIEAEKAAAEKLADEIAPYKNRIDSLVEDEKSLITRESNLAEKESEYFRKLDDLKNKSDKNHQDKTANEKRSKELDEKSESLSALETDLKVQQKEISEEQKINSDNAKQNERNLDMVKAKLADYKKVEFDHYYMKRNLETDNLITTSFDQIEKQIVDECRNGNMTLSESVHHAAESFGKNAGR